MVSFDLTGKTAIVTGGSRGLGVELSTTLAEYGANVAVMATNMERLETAAKELEGKTGRKVLPVQVRVEDEQSVRAAVDKVMREFGKIDILVNNAGVIRYGEIDQISLEDWNAVMNIDLTGTFLMSKAVANAYMKEHGGRIVNISSVNGKRAMGKAGVYNVAKAAVIALTEFCACNWAPYGIYVNSVAPGYMLNGEMASGVSEESQERLKRVIPQNRCGQYGDLSGAVLYLASDACSYTQGVTIVCDGGMIVKGY